MAISLAFLSDQETKVDFLNNEAIATTIVRLLCSRPDRPVTIGVHGDWGAGKSSVLEMIEADFAQRDRALCIKFNGWRFQGFEDAKIALMEGIVTALVEERPGLTKVADKVKEVFYRIDWLKVAKRTGGLAFTATTGIPSIELIQGALSGLTSLASNPKKSVSQEQLKTAMTEIQDLLKGKGQTRKIPDEVRQFRKAFEELLTAADIDHLIVLVDDLDRCLPDTAIETLEAIRLFVFTSRTAFVVAADEGMIEYAVRKHFPDLASSGPHTYARNYLEKLIQIPFRIPALGEAETHIYVSLLLLGAELGEEDAKFNELVAAARAILQRPWTGSTLDLTQVRAILGEEASRVEGVLQLSDQIGPVLARGTNGNPRQIKRFLNLLALRQQVAEARGFGDEIRLPILAKLMLAERFNSRLFEQLAAASAVGGGSCPELSAFEERAKSEITGTAPTRRTSKSDEPESTATRAAEAKLSQDILNEWLASESVKAWAAIPPELSGVDLRPYFFATKDRKDHFASGAMLTHLAGLVEQLLGTDFVVAALGPEVARLSPGDAVAVFEEVRVRVVGRDDFDTEPPGVRGLTALVRAHPALQTRLLDFIDGLPVDRLGLWAIRGWDDSITDAASQQRLAAIRARWEQSDNKVLATAVKGVTRVQRAGR